VDFAVELAFEIECELITCFGLGEGKGQRLILETANQRVFVCSVIVAAAEGPLCALTDSDVDVLLLVSQRRHFVLRPISVRHDRTVETRLLFLSAHFIHSLITKVTTKVLIFHTRIIVLSLIIFLMSVNKFVETFFVDDKSVKLESASMDVDSGVVWFKGTSFIFHFLIFEPVSELIDGNAFAVDRAHKLLLFIFDGICRFCFYLLLAFILNGSCLFSRFEPFSQRLSRIDFFLFGDSLSLPGCLLCFSFCFLGQSFSLFLLFFGKSFCFFLTFLCFSLFLFHFSLQLFLLLFGESFFFLSFLLQLFLSLFGLAFSLFL
jgi:hypothetical protein